jgi:hypothetical protein
MIEFLFDYFIIGVVVFVVGGLAHKLGERGFRPTMGWVICFIAVVVLWPVSVYGLLRAIFRFFLTLWKRHA